MAPQSGTPKAKGIRGILGGLTGNALISGVVSAVVAGVISLLVAHYQSQDAARQATTGQQVQEVVQLEEVAQILDQATNRLSKDEESCAPKKVTRDKLNQCTAEAPSYRDFNVALDRMNTMEHNISDPNIVRLAAFQTLAAIDVSLDLSPNDRDNDSLQEEREYSDLIGRCGKFIQGQQ